MRFFSLDKKYVETKKFPNFLKGKLSISSLKWFFLLSVILAFFVVVVAAEVSKVWSDAKRLETIASLQSIGKFDEAFNVAKEISDKTLRSITLKDIILNVYQYGQV